MEAIEPWRLFPRRAGSGTFTDANLDRVLRSHHAGARETTRHAGARDFNASVSAFGAFRTRREARDRDASPPHEERVRPRGLGERLAPERLDKPARVARLQRAAVKDVRR